MSLPDFSTQAELFSTAGLSASLFAPADRYRLFAKLVYPRLASARAKLEKCYCPENGRVALEPAGLREGKLAAGSRRTGGDTHARGAPGLLARTLGTVCRKPDRLPGGQRNAGTQAGGVGHRCLAVAGVVAGAGASAVGGRTAG